MIDNNEVSLMGVSITWRRFKQLFCTFFLILLCSQVSTFLNIKVAGLQDDILLENIQDLRKKYFFELEENMNSLFKEYNYSSWSYRAKYLGEGEILRYSRVINAELMYGSYEPIYYGVDPREELVQDWVRIGRTVMFNGKKEFVSYNLAVNGTHVALVYTYDKGDWKGDEYVSSLVRYDIAYFIEDLYNNAPDRSEGLEDIDAALADRTYRAKKFEKLFKTALRANKPDNIYQAEQSINEVINYFNQYVTRLELKDHYKMIKEPKKNGTFKIRFGRYEYVDCKIKGSVNQTVGRAYVFKETIDYDYQLDSFYIKNAPKDKTLKMKDRYKKNYLELFEYLNRTAFNLKIDALAGIKSYQRPDAMLKPASYEQGAVNTYNYEYWDEDLLSIAVVSDYSSGERNLPKLLEEAVKNDVYGWLDKFSFKNYGSPATNWKDILLDENTMRIENYDIMFIDDYYIDSWDESWGLSEKEADLLSSWLMRGGSLYLSSALSGTESIVKDKLFPAEQLQMRVSNVLSDGEFNVARDPIYMEDETPIATSLTYWDTYSDTRIANLYLKGEYANVDTFNGYPLPSLRIGVIDEFEGGVGWTYDCPSPDKVITITQKFSVPTTYAKCYFSLQYMKRTNLNSDKLEIIILDSYNKEVLNKIIVKNKPDEDTSWQFIDKLDLTKELRPYSGETLELHVRVSGEPGERIYMDHDSHPTIVPPNVAYWVYADFHVDNMRLSFIGDKSTVPIIIYYDNDLMEAIDTQEYGTWLYPYGNNYEFYPYLEINEYRSRYLADELLNKLQMNGMLNSKILNTEELENFFKYGQSGIIVPAHPFPESIYDGTSDCQIIDWVYNDGGVLFDLQAEPLAYYIDNSEMLVRIDEADLALLGYDLFKTYCEPDAGYRFAYYNENFDDGSSSFDIRDHAEVYLDEYIGGYLNITSSGSYQDNFPSPLVIRDGVDYDRGNMSVHMDLYTEDTTKLIIHGKDASGYYLGIECTLGYPDSNMENTWYTDTDLNKVYIDIPFNSETNPSELIKNKWNAILFNLDLTDVALNKEMYKVTSIEIITTGNHTSIDNLWIGFAGSTYQDVSEWFVKTLTPFVSDYPLSLKVLYDMKSDNQDFDFSIFGRSEYVKKLQYFTDFLSNRYPADDQWTELSAAGWQTNNESLSITASVACCGNSSIAWEKPAYESGNVTLHFLENDFSEYISLQLSISSNISMPANLWSQNDSILWPRITIKDVNNNELFFYIKDDFSTSWNSITLRFDEGMKNGNFDYTRINKIEFYLPSWTDESFTIYFDDVHFEMGLSDKYWDWSGVVSFLDDFLILENQWGASETWIKTKEEFGLGTLSVIAQFSPNTEMMMGFFGEATEYGSAYYHYKGYDEYWWHPDWKNRKILTIEGAEHNLYNYPVNITIPKELEMQDDYEDLRFMWGTTSLPYEITSYTDESVNLWLFLPNLKTSKTELHLYYNNPDATFNKDKYEAVWDTNFMSVVHFDYFNQGVPPSVIQVDSTSYDNFVQEIGYERYTEGIHEEGIEFDGSWGQHGLMCDFDSTKDFTDGMTLEAWIKPTDEYSWFNWEADIIGKYDETTGTNYRLYYFYQGGLVDHHYIGLEIIVDNDTYCGFMYPMIEPGEWHYLAGTYDGSILSLYIDGELVHSELGGGDITVSNAHIYIGEARKLLGDSFRGFIDEIRLSNIARTPAWIEQTYFTMCGNLSITIEEDWNLVKTISGPTAWWDANWKYRQAINVYNPSSGNLSYYQMAIYLDSSELPFDYYKCQGDGDDLRFITYLDYQHQVIDYWIQDWNYFGVNKIWLEIPYIGAEDYATIYLYYGNSIADASSSIDDTFLFAEDFQDGDIDGWSDSGGGIANSGDNYYGMVKDNWDGSDREAGMWIQLSNSEQVIVEVDHYIKNWINDGDSYMEGDFIGFNAYDSGGTFDWGISYRLAWDDSNTPIGSYTIKHGLLCNGIIDHTYSVGTYINEYNIDPIGVQQWKHYTFNLWSDCGFDSVSTGGWLEFELGISGRDHSSTNDKEDYIDNLFVRKYVYNEPIISSVDVEEINPFIDYWFNYDWTYRRRIELDIPIPSDPTILAKESLVQLQLDNTNFDYTKAQANGDDLRFTDACGNELDYCIVDWDYLGTSIIGIRRSLLSPTDDVVYLYYGNDDAIAASQGCYYFDDFTDDIWDEHNRPSDIYVDTTNNWLNIKTSLLWDDDYSCATPSANLNENFTFRFKYNTRQRSSTGAIYFGVSSGTIGPIDSPSLMDGIYLYHFGGNIVTQYKPTFRLIVDIGSSRYKSSLDTTWQPADYTWYTIKIIRSNNNVILEIWDEDDTTLLQTHTGDCSNIGDLSYIYAGGQQFGAQSHIYEYAYVSDILITDCDTPTIYYVNNTMIQDEESDVFNVDIEVTFYENGNPEEDWIRYNPAAGGTPDDNHVLEYGEMDIYQGITIVDSDVHAIMNFESDTVLNDNDLFAKAVFSLETWDGTTNIPLQFRFRATSTYAASSVTQFRLYFYDMAGNRISVGSFVASTANPNGLDWLQGTDSGWQVVSYDLLASDFAAYQGQTLYVVFGHHDSWSANHKQRSYLDYLIIGDTTIIGLENALEVVVYNGTVKKTTVIEFEEGFNPSLAHEYKIERNDKYINFYLDDVIIASFTDGLPYYNPLDLKHLFAIKTIEGHVQIDSIKIVQNRYEFLEGTIIGDGLQDDFNYRSPFPRNTTNLDDWYEIFGFGSLFQPTEWLDEDWKYRKSLKIQEESGEYLADYQVPIDLTTATITQTALIGYWNLNENSGTIAKDTSRYDNDGTFIGSPTWDNGIISSALYFDGDDYVYVTGDSLDVSNGMFTISLWIKPEEVTGYKSVFGHQTTAPSDRYPCIYVKDVTTTSGSIHFGFGTGSVWKSHTAYGVLDGANRWYHIVYSLDSINDIEKLYVNSEQVFSTTEGSTPTNKKEVYIGRSSSNFLGTIDEVRIYNDALNEDEIKQLFKINPIGTWHFDDNPWLIEHDDTGQVFDSDYWTSSEGWDYYRYYSQNGARFDGTVKFWSIGTEDYAKAGLKANAQNLGIDNDADYIRVETKLLNLADFDSTAYTAGFSFMLGNDGTYQRSAKICPVSLGRFKVGVGRSPTLDWGFSGENYSVTGSNYFQAGGELTLAIELCYSENWIKFYANDELLALDDYSMQKYYQTTHVHDVTLSIQNRLTNLYQVLEFDYLKACDYDEIRTADSSGVAEDAILNGASWTSGVENNGVKFNGNDDYARVSDSNSIMGFDENDDFSISIWLKPDQWSTGEYFVDNNVFKLYHRGDWAGDRIYFLVYINEPYYKPNIGDSAWHYLPGVSSVTHLQEGEWYHITAVKQGYNMKLFINGELEKNLECLNSSMSFRDATDLYIGSKNDGTNSIDGSIDEVRIYNNALLEEEIKEQFATGAKKLLLAGEVDQVTYDSYGCDNYLKYGSYSWEDLRFTLENGDLLDFYVENDRKAWVKIPTLHPNEELTIYMYYGNSIAESLSNGANVFDFYDDFNILDNTIWSISNGGSYSIEDGYMDVTSGSVYSDNMIDTMPGTIVESDVHWSGPWNDYSGMNIADVQGTYGSNTAGDAVLYYMATRGSDRIRVWAAEGGTAGYDIASGLSQFTAINDRTYLLGYTITNDEVIIYKDGQVQNVYSGSWSSDFYLFLGHFRGSYSNNYDCTDISVDWVRTRKYVSIEPTVSFGDEELPTTSEPIIYNNEYVTIDFEDNLGDLALLFEYDGDLLTLGSNELSVRTIERRIGYLDNFTTAIPITWWQEQTSGYREFSIEFYHYHDGVYDLLSRASLIDTSESDSGFFVLTNSDGSYTNTSSSLSGSVILEVIRSGDTLTIAFKDSETHTTILSLQDLDNQGYLNCLRLRFAGKWGEGINSRVSHSKVWVDSINIESLDIYDPVKTTYDVNGDIFVDPAAFSFGEGYFCFVKNTPIKPLTVSYNEEIKVTTDWIVGIVENYFVNKIVPSFDLFWQSSPTGNYQINPYNEFGAEIFNAPYLLDTLTDETNGVINKYALQNFEGSLAFEQDLTYLDVDDCYSLNSGYLENWIVNFYSNYGLGVSYPDSALNGVQKGKMMPGSSLFHTTFNENFWSYDFDNDGDSDYYDSWRLYDYGRNDFLVNTTGMIYDDLHTNDWVLSLDRYSLTYDPGFVSEGTLNDYYSPHFMVYADDYDAIDGYIEPTDEMAEYHSDIDYYVGDPAPTAYFYNYMDDNNVMFLGTTVSINEIEKLYHDYNVRDWLFSFDYWIGNTSSTEQEIMDIKFFRPTTNEFENPTSVTDLFESTDFEEIYESLSGDFVGHLYNDNTDFNTHNINLDHVFNDYATNHGSEEYLYVVLTVNLDNFENQTAYFDNIRITPDGLYNVGGLGQKYGLKLEVQLEEIDGFDPITDAKIVNYPYIYLDGVFTTDPLESFDKDYEIITKVIDPTYNREIYLHYFWSDDNYITENEFTNEDYLINSNEVHFYIQREELIHYSPQLVQLSIMEDISKLIQRAKIRVDREHLIHTLYMEVNVDNYANHLQISSISIEGVNPWKEVIADNHRISSEALFGNIQGRTETTFLATSYIWSGITQKVYASLGCDSEASLFVNDQLMMNFNSTYSFTYPLEEVIELKAGLNKITLNILNKKDGSEFSLRFFNQEGTGLLTGVKILTSEDVIANSPLVSGTFGNGLVNLIGFNFDSSYIGEPYSDEPIYKLLTNILISELEHRNLYYQSIKQRLLSIIQESISNKHQDRNNDWHNEDDPLTAFEDDEYYEIISHIQSLQRDVNLLFHQVMTKARTKNGQKLTELEIEEFNVLIAEMFYTAQMTGTNYDTNGGYYWYPHDNLLFEFTDPYNYGDYNYPIFPDMDLTKSVAISFDALGGLKENRYFIYIRGMESTTPNGLSSTIQIKQHKYWYDWFYHYPNSGVGQAKYFGEFNIYGHKIVDVTDDIENDENKILLSESDSSYQNPISLLDAFNASFYAIRDFVTYKSQTNNDPFLGTISDKIPISHTDTMLSELSVGRNLKSFFENWQMNLYLSSVSGTLAFIAGLTAQRRVEYPENVYTDHDIEELVKYYRNIEPNQKSQNYFASGNSYIKRKNNNPTLNDYYLTKYGRKFNFNTMIHSSHFGNSIARASYFAGPYENLNIFGSNGLPTDVLNDILAKVYAHYLHDDKLPNDLIIIDNIKGSSSTLVFKPTDAKILHEDSNIYPSDEAGIEWLKGDIEGLSSQAQSFLSSGIHREINLKLIMSKNNKPALIRETQLKIDQEVFHNTLTELLHDENSPFYRELKMEGTDGKDLKNMIKLEHIGNDDSGDYYQLIGYHPKAHGEEIKTDIIVRKTTTGKYEVAYLREGKNPHYEKIDGVVQSKECFYRFGTRPTEQEIKNELGVASLNDVVIKKFEFQKNGQDVWLTYRKSSGTTMYALGSKGAIQIPENIETVKTTWTNDELLDYKHQNSETTGNGEYTPYSSISQVDNVHNKFTVITRTETIDSIKNEIIALLKKNIESPSSTEKKTEIHNAILYVLIPLLVLPKAMNRMAGMDDSISQYQEGSNFVAIKRSKSNPREVFADVIRELCSDYQLTTKPRTGKYKDKTIPFINDDTLKKWVNGQKITSSHMGNKKILQKILDNIDSILENNGWGDSCLGELTTSKSSEFLKKITEFCHHESASGTERLNEYIGTNFGDKKFATVRSWLYSYLQRKDGGYIIEIDDQEIPVAFINDFDRWYEMIERAQTIYLGSGRENQRDGINGEYNPLLERAKIFLWMEGVLATFKSIDQMFDTSKEDSPGYLPLTTKNIKSRHSLSFFRNNIYQKSEDMKKAQGYRGFYVFTQWSSPTGNLPAVRLLNGATIAGLRSNLQLMMHNYLMTGGVDIGLGNNIDKLAKLVGLDDIVQKLINPKDNIDIYQIKSEQARVPDPYDPSKQLNRPDLNIAKLHPSLNNPFCINSAADLKRFTKKDGRTVIKNVGINLYAQPLFRGATDTSDYTFGDLLIDTTYEIECVGEVKMDLKFYKHVTYWDPSATPKDENGNPLTVVDPDYPGGAWVTEKIELGKHDDEHVLVVDSNFKKSDGVGSYFVKDENTQVYQLGAAKILIIKVVEGSTTKYQVYGNFFTREHITHTLNQPNKKDFSTTLESCVISDEQKQIFFEQTGIAAWASKEEISLDDIEIIPVSNDIEHKLDLHKALVKDFQSYLHENNNHINRNSKNKEGFILKLAVTMPYHALSQCQYWGSGLNLGHIPTMEEVMNRFMFYKEKTLKLISEIKNLLIRTKKQNGQIDYKEVQEIQRARMQSDTKAGRKARMEKDSRMPGKSPHEKSKVSKSDIKKYFPNSLSEYFFGLSIGTFGLSNIVGFVRNVRTQLWQSKIIEFASYAMQEDTYMMNEFSRKPGADGTYVAEDAEVGYLEKRYSVGEDNENAAFWKFGEGLVYAGAVWVTDYIEVGPADCFEYINGMLNGIQLAKVDYGMQPVCLDFATTIVICLQNFTTEVLNRDLPNWLSNVTQVTQHPAFKTYWYVTLFVLGSVISVFTELVKACTMSTFVGGLTSTAISLAASSVTQKTWSGINQATIQSLATSGFTDHWSYYQKGDEAMYWKINAYKVLNWMYCAGSALRPEGAFFELFYLSNYFPKIGEWAGPFDSMLPFVVLTTFGVGMIMTYLASVLMPVAVASGALTAGIGALIVVAIIAVTFIVLRILKALGLFKKKNTSTTGDD